MARPIENKELLKWFKNNKEIETICNHYKMTKKELLKFCLDWETTTTDIRKLLNDKHEKGEL